MSPPVYMDCNATTPLAPEVVTAISSSLGEWGNPSSQYSTGRRPRHLVSLARQQVADMLGAKTEEITFTSGGTESNHLALWSALAGYRSACRPAATPCPSTGPPCHPSSLAVPHIVTSNVEHCALALPLARLEQEGLARVTRVPVVPGTGRVQVQAVLQAVEADTCMVSLMLANNETGVLQPVAEVFRELREKKPRTMAPLILHTDAAQAVGKVPVKVAELGADMVTIVGHKFYGPRIGALYHRTGVQVTPLYYGGGQESGLRPGTENTPMVAGLGAACRLVTDHLQKYSSHMAMVRNYLREQLIRNFELVTGDECGGLKLGQVCWRMVDLYCLPNTLSVRFGGCRGPELLELCSEDLEASCGASCHSGDLGVSAVLLASCRWGEEGARETVRLSVGRETSKEDVDRVVAALARAVAILQ